jgi:hypothetical protein
MTHLKTLLATAATMLLCSLPAHAENLSREREAQAIINAVEEAWSAKPLTRVWVITNEFAACIRFDDYFVQGHLTEGDTTKPVTVQGCVRLRRGEPVLIEATRIERTPIAKSSGTLIQPPTEEGILSTYYACLRFVQHEQLTRVADSCYWTSSFAFTLPEFAGRVKR